MSDTLTQMVTYRGTDSQTQQSVTITARSAYENIDPGAIKKGALPFRQARQFLNGRRCETQEGSPAFHRTVSILSVF